MFTLQNAPVNGVPAAGLTLTVLPVETDTAKFDLTLSVAQTADGLQATFEYSSVLFDAPTIARMAEHFRVLLEAIDADADARVSALPVLTAAERRRVLFDWNRTTTDFPAGLGIHQLFETQAAATPQAVAVIDGERRLSYGELNARANRLARYLRRAGVGPEALVGVYMERSLDLVVALLGILKAGGAYVPLDPSYPAERLAFMLADAGAPVLLTQRALAGSQPEYGGRTICLDGEADRIAQEPADDLEAGASGDSLAYVLYTSGSTGKPKGVMVEHRAVNRLVVNTDYVRLGPDDVVAQASNASFDAATFEIWGALLHGARLVVIDKGALLSPADLAAAIERHRIGVLFLTTALFNQLAARAPGVFRGLRQVLFGGEAVDPRWVDEVVRQGPPERLLHVYGPTETTTFATWHRVRQVTPEGATVPIGRPIANTTLYVLDRYRNPVPIGVPGELYVGGPGVARGYLNRPELTAERFVADPFSGAPGAHLYRTGDLVRSLPDGSVEFVGRLDQQVKIRGFRIEPGEIEAVLGEYPGVEEAVVAVQDGGAAGKRLIAYIVPVPGLRAAPAAEGLREHVRGRLPEYMVPAAYVTLPALPLTVNGKVDRGVLPAPDAAAFGSGAGSIAPRTPVERGLVEIWERLLGVESLGVTDDFFDVGGHSLLVVSLLTEVERVFGRRLPLATFFQATTIEQLGAVLDAGGTATYWSSLVPIRPEGTRPPLFCVHPLGGDVLCYHSMTRALSPEQPVYGLQARGLDGLQEPVDSVERMAADYVDEIKRVQPAGPYHLLGFSSGGSVAYEMACQLLASGDEVALLANIDHPPTTSDFYRPRPGLKLFGNIALNLARRALRVARRTSRDPGRWRTRPRKPAKGAGRAPARLVARLRRLTVTRPLETSQVVEMVARNVAGAAARLPAHHRKIIEIHFAALRRYVPGPYAGRVTLFRAEQPPLICTYDPTLGWDRLAAGGVQVHLVPGGHYGILHESNVPVLVRQLEPHLAAPGGAGTGRTTR
jgi:amino acid adenylation domain-containing protein